MKRPILFATFLGLLLAAALVQAPSTARSAAPAAGTASPATAFKPPITKAEKIKNAMSAAPAAISKDATILDYPDDPAKPFVELRKGKNEWTCFPDWNATPGNDPQCNDRVWMAWMDALMAGKTFSTTTPGLAYMLAGGSDASADDPAAMAPKPGEDWITSPPHVMVIFPGKLDPTTFSTDHHSGKPWVMFAGTPYEHVMMPVNMDGK